MSTVAASRGNRATHDTLGRSQSNLTILCGCTKYMNGPSACAAIAIAEMFAMNLAARSAAVMPALGTQNIRAPSQYVLAGCAAPGHALSALCVTAASSPPVSRVARRRPRSYFNTPSIRGPKALPVRLAG